MSEPTATELAALIKALSANVDKLQASVTTLQQASSSTSKHSGEHHNDRPPRFQKMDFPKFDGKSDPLAFINCCESYFHQQRIAEEEKVWIASYNLEDAAQLWYTQVQQDEGTPPWRRFTELLHLRFGPPLHTNPLGELMACKRTGSVVDYQDKLEALLPRAGKLTEEQRIQIFTAGLQLPLSLDVEIHNPQTLVFAMSLARKLELRNQCVAPAAPPRHNQRGLLPAPPQLLALPAPPPPTAPSPATVTVEGRTVKRLSQAEMEERRRLGLCFNCNDKFSRGHNRVCQRLFLLDLAAPDDDYDDDSTPEETGETDPHVSLHAIAGVRFSDTMQVHINMGGANLLALLDSGSTHKFVSMAAASRTKLKLLPRGQMQVTVANGERVPCPGLYRNTAFSIDGETFHADFFALPLAG
ncbi:uncharacterized protein [Oryza sativa Japonica Group]|uniref:uncharacterized protein n=1 Tax=Oryza sativa subsp. japonica TaxID=39947 RepID=UPI0001C7DB89